jgi:hypothetical protein
MPQRRHLLTALPALLLSAAPLRALAHHGWSSFDQNRPLYLSGRAARVAWRNPHAELTLELAENLSLPADLASRVLPAQSARVDGPALLRAAQLPTRRDRLWEVELAPLSRMNAWRVPEIKAGDSVELLGFTFIEERGDPILRGEFVFVGGQAYGLRSSPA